VAATIEAGAPPLRDERPDLPRRVLAAIDRALAVDPARRPRAAELAAELREAAAAGHERPARRPLRLPRPQALTLPAAPVALETRALSAGVAGLATVVGGAVLPFWTPGLLALLAIAAAAATWWAPRLGLALALFAPVFPLGNEAKGAALLYLAFAAALLALGWRDPRAGLAFAAGPLLAPVGGLMLVPLAVQPARGWVRRSVHAALALPAAALVACLHGGAIPLAGAQVPDLGLAATDDPGAVLGALRSVVSASPALATTSVALALVAALLPRARSRGRAAIAVLCAGEVALVLGTAPSLPVTPVVLGAWALCGALTLGRAR
jgi:hypothetical protein